MVGPDALGFREEDAPIPPPRMSEQEHVGHTQSVQEVRTAEPTKAHVPARPRVSMPAVSFAWASNIPRMIKAIKIPKKGLVWKVGLVLGIVLLGWLLYYSIPRATVTVLVLPQSIEENATLSIDPAATVADSDSKIIPGRTQEKSVNGEKTIPVSGKKNIGDPAKGSVTIYNKVTSSRNFPKGTTLTANGVAFTLDSDVSVASASETIGSITFGKTTAAVTAKDIGPNGNVPAGTEFSFSNVSASQVSARNDAAMSGGTSKQVTVVSRADQDALVKALTDELITKAKEEFLTQTQGERLIDQTVKTEVTEKIFGAELDEQVGELSGKVTVTITGVTVRDDDIQSVLGALVEDKVPSGYQLAPERTKVETSNVQVKTGGAMSVQAKMTAFALPELDTDSLKKSLAGKSVSEALAILKETKGVSGAEYRFSMSPTTNRLPLNSANITITESVQ
jgi:hypothetical protein